jgi:hypothetical protein
VSIAAIAETGLTVGAGDEGAQVIGSWRPDVARMDVPLIKRTG